MLKELLAERAYLPILRMNDGRPVTRENWDERRRELTIPDIPKHTETIGLPVAIPHMKPTVPECRNPFMTAYDSVIRQATISCTFIPGSVIR